MRNGGAAGPSSRRAIVVGGSMAGLFTALLLQRDGWQVDVFERARADMSGRGAGIVTHPELFDVLERVGVDPDAARVGVSVAGRRVFRRDGAIVGELPLPQILTSWARLHHLLRQAFPAENLHHGRALTRFTEGEGSVVADFADGTSSEADLLVGADGISSTVRGLAAPEVAPAYVGYVAWRGLAEEAALSVATREALFDHFSFSLPDGEQMLGYPVAGPDEAMAPGRRRYNFVWYRPAAPGGALNELLTDADGVVHALSIPPNRIRPELTRSLRETARRLLAPQFAEVVEATKQPFLQAIQDLEVPRMALGPRTVILGDAAFVARPHVGMGVTKAAGDAAALADALASEADIAAALARFEAERRPYGAAVIRRGRELGAYMQAQLLSEEERRLAERHRRPEAVMAETAVAHGIAA